MKIKDFMAFCAVVACFPFAAWAIPADPRPKHVFQPDGVGLTIIIKGDEHGYMLSTDDGIPLYYNSQTRAFEYAGLTGNTLTGSGINPQMQPTGMQGHWHISARWMSGQSVMWQKG